MMIVIIIIVIIIIIILLKSVTGRIIISCYKKIKIMMIDNLLIMINVK